MKMVKRVSKVICAIALIVVAALAAASVATPTSAWAEVLQPTSWDDEQYVVQDGSRTYIYVGAHDTLDLSVLDTGPDADIVIRIVGNDATIKGNPAVQCDNLYLMFLMGYDDGDGEFVDDDVTVHLDNLRMATDKPDDQFYTMVDHVTDSSARYPDQIVFSYAGANALYCYMSTSVRDADITFDAQAGASLDVGFTSLGNGSSAGAAHNNVFTFDGGVVTSTPITYYNPSSEGGIRITGGCDFSVTSEDATCGIQLYQVNTKNYHSNPQGTGFITIDGGSKVSVSLSHKLAGNNESGIIGGIVGGDVITIDNSSVDVQCSEPGYIGIGFAGAIKIRNGSEASVRTNTAKSSVEALSNHRDAGIGGDFNMLEISGSTVRTEAFRGAAIGKRGAFPEWQEERITESPLWNTRHLYPTDGEKEPLPQSISITDSVVEASSVYGAGIGSGGNCNWVASHTDIAIDGASQVTARSVYGAGIGAGVATVDDEVEPGIPLGGITTSPSESWDDAEVEDASAEMALAAVRSLLAAPMVSRAASNGDANELGEDEGTLTITGSPVINVESGTRAVTLDVAAGQPMMQYTLDEYPEVATPINRVLQSGDDAGAGAPSYALQPGYRSLAFWPVSAGTYTLTYGSGDNPDPLLDVTDEARTYASEYAVSNVVEGESALRAFDVVRQRELGGRLVVTANSVEVKEPVEPMKPLYAVAFALTPSMSSSDSQKLSYQWYQLKDDSVLLCETGVSCRPMLPGRYLCVVTGTGAYRGSVASAIVAVANSSSETVPSAPTVSDRGTQITASSITLDYAGDGYQYGLVTVSSQGEPSIVWQDTPAFVGLDRNSSYVFVQREGEYGAVSLSATFTTNAGRPAKSDMIIDYVNETFSLSTGVSAYRDSKCTEKVYTSSLDGLIARSDAIAPTTVYLAFDDAAEHTEQTVTPVEIPKRPPAPALDSASIASTQTSISLPSQSGTVYALLTEGGGLLQQIDGTGDTITFGGEGSELSAGTTYILRARTTAVATTGDTQGSFQSMQSSLKVTTADPKSSIAVVPTSQTVDYDGTAHAFEFTTIPKDLDRGNITLTYYERGEYETSLAGAPTDVGRYRVNVKRTETNEHAAYSEWFDFEITKGTPATPAAPTLESRTTTSITLQGYTVPSGYGAIQYGYTTDGSTNVDNWQESPTFENLSAGVMYTFFARYGENDLYKQSAMSSGIAIATVPAAPAASSISIDFAFERLKVPAGCEVSTDASFGEGRLLEIDEVEGSLSADISWIVPAFGQPDVTLYVRVAADGDTPESAATSVTIPARPKAPSGLETTMESAADALDGSISGLSADVTYEYREAGQSGAWTPVRAGSTEIAGLASGAYDVRVAAVEGKSFASAASTATVVKARYALVAENVTCSPEVYGYESSRYIYSVLVSNEGNCPVVVTGVSFDSEGERAFALKGEVGDGIRLEPGDAFTIVDRFEPVLGLSAGDYQGTVSVRARAVDERYTGEISTSAKVTFSVKRSLAELEAVAYNGDAPAQAFTYGDTIYVRATIGATGQAASSENALTLASALAGRVLTAPTAGQAALFLRATNDDGTTVDTQLAEPQSITGASNQLIFAYNTAEKGIPVGDATLVVKFTGNNNMESAEAEVKISLTKATIVPTGITVSDVGRIYDGTTALPSGASVGVTIRGVVPGDTDVTVSATDAAYTSKDAGTKTVSASKFTLVATSGDATDWSDWYTVANPTVALTAEDSEGIAKRPMTVTVQDEAITYGDAVPTAGKVSYSPTGGVGGLVSGEAPNLSFSYGYERYGNVSGSPFGIRVMCDKSENFDPGNYDISPVAGKLTVQPKVIELVWGGLNDRVYGDDRGEVTCEPTEGAIVNDDDVTVKLTYSCEHEGDDHLIAGQHTLTAELVGDKQKVGNYQIADGDASRTYTIAQSTSSMTVGTYNGTTETDRFMYGDTITVQGTVETTGYKAGSGIEDWEDGGSNSGVATMNALAAPTADQVALFYDADGDGEGAARQISDAVTVDDNGNFSLTYNTTDRVVPTGEGIELEVRYIGTGDRADVRQGVEVSIARAPLAPVVSWTVSKTYDGTTNVPEAGDSNTLAIAFNKDQIKGGDAPTATASFAYASKNVAEAIDINATDIALDGESAKWYELTAKTVTGKGLGTIAKAPLTVRATGGTITYGDSPAAALGLAFDGLVNGETEESLRAAGELTGAVTVACDYKQGDPVESGSFDITLDADTFVAMNYKISLEGGTLTVQPRVVRIDWAEPPAGGYVVGDGVDVTAAIANAYESDDVSLVLEGHDADVAGSHTARVTGLAGADAANYRLPATGEEGAGSLEQEYTIQQSGTEFPEEDGLTVKNGDGEETRFFTYGERVVVTATPAATGEPADAAGAQARSAENGTEDGAAAGSADSAVENQASLYYRPAGATDDGSEDVLVAGPVGPNADGSYELSYDTTSKIVPVGSATLVVKYSGNADLAPAEKAFDVSIVARSLTARVDAGGEGVSKTYDGSTAVPDNVGISLEGVLAGDDVTASAQDIAYNSKNVDEATRVTATGIGLSGDAAAFYTVNDTADAPATIVPATLTVLGGVARVPYGTAETPQVAVTYEGFVDGESLEGLVAAGELTDADTVTTFCDVLDATTPAGTQMELGVRLGSLRARNYTFDVVYGALEVVKAAPVVDDADAAEQSLAAGATAGDLAVPALVGVDGSELQGTVTWYADAAHEHELSADDTLAVGTSTLYWVFTPGDANYEAASGAVQVTVAQAEEPEPDDPEPDDSTIPQRPGATPGGGDGPATDDGPAGSGTTTGGKPAADDAPAGSTAADKLSGTGDAALAMVTVVAGVAVVCLILGVALRGRMRR